jgi:hypothetical protein
MDIIAYGRVPTDRVSLFCRMDVNEGWVPDVVIDRRTGAESKPPACFKMEESVERKLNTAYTNYLFNELQRMLSDPGTPESLPRTIDMLHQDWYDRMETQEGGEAA